MPGLKELLIDKKMKEKERLKIQDGSENLGRMPIGQIANLLDNRASFLAPSQKLLYFK
jgi:hypothetical protein